MDTKENGFGTIQDRWARFRFSVVGPLLACPPEEGALKTEITMLAKKQWRHPITGESMTLGSSTIERWFYLARKTQNPVYALRTKRRSDAGKSWTLSEPLKQYIRVQHREYPSFSYQLHWDNLEVKVKGNPELGEMPSYNTVRRYMKENAMTKKRRIPKKDTAGAALALERLASREVRSFEVDHVNSLWHLDFHHGSRAILCRDGQWKKPLLLAILDDRSRLICHAQWYLDETNESLVHGFIQALQKRGLPRALMSDNGSAMTSAEFTEGLERLSILHKTTLPYSPYQNAKQEIFWAQVEGRLMAMLENKSELSLSLLNTATIAWIEQEYHRKLHSEIGCTPLERYLTDTNIGRSCPDSTILRQFFCTQMSRKQRQSDGTISLNGKRFEIPSAFRHVERLVIRYARWDLSHVWLIDPYNNHVLAMLYPQDKSANASGKRRIFDEVKQIEVVPTIDDVAPLLKSLMAEYAATGFPPAYQPKGEKK